MFYEKESKDNFAAILEAIRIRMHEKGTVMIAVTTARVLTDLIDLDHTKVGDEILPDEELHFKFQHIHTQDDEEWLAALTSYEEYRKGEITSTIQYPIEDVLKGFKDMHEPGIILNPWGINFKLSKELIEGILTVDRPDNHIYFDLGNITDLAVEAVVNAANNPKKD